MPRTKTRSSAQQSTSYLPLSMLSTVLKTQDKPVIKSEPEPKLKLGVSVEQSTVSVTPELAKKWLKTNIDHNRNVVQSKVDKWAKAMESGQWGVGSPILFDKHGRLFDGQHRLLALIKCGLTIKFAVMYGYDPEAAQIVDLGMSRRLEQIAQMQGKKFTSAHSSIMRAMLIPHPKYHSEMKTLSHQDLIDLMEDYMPYIEYAQKVLPSKSSFLNKAQVLAALARAAYFYNVINEPDSAVAERLNEARIVLKTGMTANDEDSALIKLRDWLNSNKNLTNGTAMRILTYNMCDYYIWLFMYKKPRKNMSLPERYEAKMLVPPLTKLFG